MGHSNETYCSRKKEENQMLKPPMSVREVAQGAEKREGRQPQVFIATSTISSLTTSPQGEWVKGNHMRWGYHDRLGQKDL